MNRPETEHWWERSKDPVVWAREWELGERDWGSCASDIAARNPRAVWYMDEGEMKALHMYRERRKCWHGVTSEMLDDIA